MLIDFDPIIREHYESFIVSDRNNVSRYSFLIDPLDCGQTIQVCDNTSDDFAHEDVSFDDFLATEVEKRVFDAVRSCIDFDHANVSHDVDAQHACDWEFPDGAWIDAHCDDDFDNVV
jgi:hypothetical protein